MDPPPPHSHTPALTFPLQPPAPPPRGLLGLRLSRCLSDPASSPPPPHDACLVRWGSSPLVLLCPAAQAAVPQTQCPRAEVGVCRPLTPPPFYKLHILGSPGAPYQPRVRNALVLASPLISVRQRGPSPTQCSATAVDDPTTATPVYRPSAAPMQCQIPPRPYPCGAGAHVVLAGCVNNPPPPLVSNEPCIQRTGGVRTGVLRDPSQAVPSFAATAFGLRNVLDCKISPPPCISYALVQATVGVGTVLIWDLILIRCQT